jgi:hypothetical protein
MTDLSAGTRTQETVVEPLLRQVTGKEVPVRRQNRLLMQASSGCDVMQRKYTVTGID